MGSMPSMSRPSGSVSRPSGGNMAVNRQGGGARQAIGNLPNPAARPAGGATRPGTGNIAGNRPNIGQGGERVTQGQLQNFLDLPGGGGAARPSTRPAGFPNAGAIAGGALAGGAAAEFLRSRESAPLVDAIYFGSSCFGS
jgi:hypothetical protein